MDKDHTILLNAKKVTFSFVFFVKSLCPLWFILYHEGHKERTKDTKKKCLVIDGA